MKMSLNTVYLETITNNRHYVESRCIEVPLETLISYCVYRCCSPNEILVVFVNNKDSKKSRSVFTINEDDLELKDSSEVHWQVSSCLYPAVLLDDTVITGVCAVVRHICKYVTTPISKHEHDEGILGFRKGCLQAPNEVSIWTKFCEVDIINSVQLIMNIKELKELPLNLLRFENHLKKPVKVHNVYKFARELKKETAKKDAVSENLTSNLKETSVSKERVAKPRKWKSNTKKQLELDHPRNIEDLNIPHQFAEGPFMTIADLVLLPSFYILIQSIGKNTFEKYLPLTYSWFTNLLCIPGLKCIIDMLLKLEIDSIAVNNIIIPTVDDVSLYKCDPKRHNPKKRLFTRDDDIENALSSLMDGMKLDVTDYPFISNIEWQEIPDGANPTAGHLPDNRMHRKQEQLQNLALACLQIAQPGDLIVDFCSGSGHLGILVAYLLPQCKVILLENKEQSLLRARERVHNMKLTNVCFYQCNLDFFIGKFNIGLALHACGIASDLVLDKCLKAKAKFVLCPCCYGSLHTTDRLVYPRSKTFYQILTTKSYICIGHAADQTHDNHPLTARGAKCMEIIDSDRARLAEENGYTVTLSKLHPLSCTPKNNLLIGVPT